MSFGSNLSFYRKQAGLTQQQLSERLNVSPQAISKWENDLAEPDILTIGKLAEIYNVTIDRLINKDCEPAVQPAEPTPQPAAFAPTAAPAAPRAKQKKEEKEAPAHHFDIRYRTSLDCRCALLPFLCTV